MNKYEEALNALTGGMLDTSDIEMYMDVIVEALKLKIPVKVVPTPSISGTRNDYYCPNCYHGLDRYSPYCDECGRLLDWEGV